MAHIHRHLVIWLLFTFLWITFVSSSDTTCRHHRKQRQSSSSHRTSTQPNQSSHTKTHDNVDRFLRRIRKQLPTASPPSSDSSDKNISVDKRGLPGIAGDIEWMGFYGSLLAIPTMLSVLGIVTDYNLEKSYFNSQINAQYYKQTREMLRAHSAKLIQEQEQKFAKAGQTWNGMIYDQDGNVNKGAKLPSWGGATVAAPPRAEDGQGGKVGAGGGAGGAASTVDGAGPGGKGAGDSTGVAVSGGSSEAQGAGGDKSGGLQGA